MNSLTMKRNIGKLEFIQTLLYNVVVMKKEYLDYHGKQFAIKGYPGINPESGDSVTVEGWGGIPLWWDARPIKGVQKKFPQTMSMKGLTECPSHVSTGWLVLQPNSGVEMHNHKYDKWKGKLLMHIPLILGKGSCGITVNNTEHQWKLYEPIVFDAEAEHGTWNHTDEPRVNFVVDFPREEWESILEPYIVR
jgi:aspartyl/asparaginyl beta-hydroxylase (cupin superfamily)